MRSLFLSVFGIAIFSGCGGNQPTVTEKRAIKSVEDTSLQIIDKENDRVRIANSLTTDVTESSGSTNITSVEKTIVVIDESILNPELYDLQGEKDRVVTDETIDRVIAKLKKLKKAPKRDILSLIKIAEAYLEVKDYKNALESFNQVLEIQPQNLAGVWGRATVAYYLKDYKLSLEDFTLYTVLKPNNAPAYGNRGVVYDELGKSELAISDYSKAIEIDPNYESAYYNRGTVYGKELEKYELAISDYSKAIEIDPNYADAYSNRGTVYGKELGKYELAISDYSKAIEIDPNLASAYSNRGVAYALSGNLKKAKEDAIRASQLGDSKLMKFMKQNGLW
jgi:tetratricopeptide (TPR) repeat protein